MSGKVTLFISGISGSKEIKKRQQHISSMLQAQNIPFETVDVASDPSALDRMRELVTKGKPKIKDPDDEEEDEEEEEEVILAPQIANGDEYCGGYEDFENAIEMENLKEFLKLK
ncbi:SH3 domain-binding glutamic acid-rich-like protein 3 [Porites lutea]|uniref:SH3 domain-binding glutamic acid-rich-like protein 3 n=1 Tax=Porites lutea TaxID=51062 RepID=UPI003CC69AB3